MARARRRARKRRRAKKVAEAARRRPRPRAPEVRLLLRRRPGRRQRRDEEPARRQGRQPRRDGRLGLPVPPGLHDHDRGLHLLLRQHGARYPAGLDAAGRASTSRASRSIVGRRFGDPTNPLLVSVRSGARASMPGMMDTILNLGLNDETVAGPDRATRATRASPTTRYRRFVQMYGDVVLGVKPESTRTEPIRSRRSSSRRSTRAASKLDTELTADDLRELVGEFKALVKQRSRRRLPGRSARAALGRDRRRVRLVEERRAPSPTASSTTSPTTGARRSTCRRWCSATSATTARPASPSRATRRPARSASTASS